MTNPEVRVSGEDDEGSVGMAPVCVSLRSRPVEATGREVWHVGRVSAVERPAEARRDGRVVGRGRRVQERKEADERDREQDERPRPGDRQGRRHSGEATPGCRAKGAACVCAR